MVMYVEVCDGAQRPFSDTESSEECTHTVWSKQLLKRGLTSVLCIEAFKLCHQNSTHPYAKTCAPIWGAALYGSVYPVSIKNELASQVSSLFQLAAISLHSTQHSRCLFAFAEENSKCTKENGKQPPCWITMRW